MDGCRATATGLGVADGFCLALIEAQSGYRGEVHQHKYPEFLSVIDGELHNQGQPMVRGDGYAAASGSSHTDFGTETGSGNRGPWHASTTSSTTSCTDG